MPSVHHIMTFATLYVALTIVVVTLGSNDMCPVKEGSSYTFTVTLNINRTGHRLVLVNMQHETPFHIDDRNETSLYITHTSTSCGKRERIELTTSAVLLEHIRPKGDGYEFFPGLGYYKLHKVGRTWDDARATCLEEGGHLLVINSDEEARVVKEFFARRPEFTNVNDPLYGAYVGITDREIEGQWRTVTGQLLEETGYPKWYPGEPKVGDRGQNYVAAEKGGLYHDIANGRRMAFICEIE